MKQEDKLNTYYTDTNFQFKPHSSSNESLHIHVHENKYIIAVHDEERDKVIHIDMTEKSARILSKMLELSANYYKSICGQSWGQHPVDETQNSYEEFPHLRNRPSPLKVSPENS